MIKNVYKDTMTSNKGIQNNLKFRIVFLWLQVWSVHVPISTHR